MAYKKMLVKLNVGSKEPGPKGIIQILGVRSGVLCGVLEEGRVALLDMLAALSGVQEDMLAALYDLCTDL